MLIRFLGAQWLATAFFSVVSFLLSIAIARIFGPEKFGTYSIAFSVGALFLFLIEGGFSRVLMREKVRISEGIAFDHDALMANALGHALIVTTAICLVIFLFAEDGQHLILLTLVATYGFLALGQFSMATLRGQGRLVWEAWLQIVNRALTAIFIVLALVVGAEEPWEIFAAQAVGGSIFAVLVMGTYRIRPCFSLSPSLYRVVLPFVWIDMASLIYFRSDIVLMRVLEIPKQDIGCYGIAFKIIEAILMFSTPIGLMLFRHFRIKGLDKRVATSMLANPILVAMVSGFMGGGGAYFFADLLVLFFFGDSYAAAGYLLTVMSASLGFAFANIVLMQAAQAWNMEKLCLWAVLAASVVSLSGNVFLLPSHGVVAAAWTFVATQAAMGLVIAIGLYRNQKQSPI